MVILSIRGVDEDKRHTKEYHDLDTLFGSWSIDEFKYIQGKIDRERRIDKKLWE